MKPCEPHRGAAVRSSRPQRDGLDSEKLAQGFLAGAVFCSYTGIGTEFLAHGENIEVTRQDSTFELSPVPV